MVLRERLKSTRMSTSENLDSYLTNIAQVGDELSLVGEKVDGSELVRTVVNGVTKTWTDFVEAIVSRDNFPSWDILWDDFMHEETWRGLEQGSSSKGKEEKENVAVSTTSKKPKKGGVELQRGEQKKDLSRLRCYASNAFGHCASQCRNKKRGKQGRRNRLHLQQRSRFLCKV